MLVEVASGRKNLVQWDWASSFNFYEEQFPLTDAKEQAGSEPSGTRPVESEDVSGKDFGSGPKPSLADTQPGSDFWGTVIPTGALLAGRYRIDHFIARGGMGEVYAAHDCVLAEGIALKTVTGTSSGDMGALSALRAEVTLSRKISHPNVCRMHDIGVHVSQAAPQLTFLTMEYVDGESLGARVGREGAIPEVEAARLLAGILMGLQAAHDAGVLHRDLKSDNVMLRHRPGADSMPVIMDFGLASALSPNSSRVSSEQAMVGSLAYMAPEQVQGDALRVATDIYSVGVIFFEMLTGQLPFKASSPALAALKRLHEPAPRVRSIDPRISPTLDRILAKALQHRPQDRYPSARAMYSELTEYLERGEQPAPDTADAVPESSAPGSDPTDEETTLVTGRAYGSAPSPRRPSEAALSPRRKSDAPPPSVDNSLPVLAATAPPTRPTRPRRLIGLAVVAGAAVGLVLLTLALPSRKAETVESASMPTIGISERPGAVLTAPEVRRDVNERPVFIPELRAPTEIVEAASAHPSSVPPSASIASGAPAATGTTVSGASPATSAKKVQPPPGLMRPPGVGPTSGATTHVTPAASAAPTPSAAPAPSAPRGTNPELAYPPGVKRPAPLRPTDAPGVQ